MTYRSSCNNVALLALSCRGAVISDMCILDVGQFWFICVFLVDIDMTACGSGLRNRSATIQCGMTTE